ncbi:MAG: hypothetical protein ACTSRP_16810 [Candidatus Helarchaeota archaeon]
MRFTVGSLSKVQLKYLAIIEKIDKSIDRSSIIAKIPDPSDLDEKYKSEIKDAKSGFERMKIEKRYQTQKKVIENLIQIKFNHPEFKFPIYFETVRLSTTKGTLIDFTLNTIIEKYSPVVFIGRVRKGAGNIKYLPNIYTSVGLSPENSKSFLENLSEEFKSYFIDVNDFTNGNFETADFYSGIRELGRDILLSKVNKNETSDNNIAKSINNNPKILAYLKKIYYRELRTFIPIETKTDHIPFSELRSECIGIILPINDQYSFIQLADGRNINKSPIFQILKIINKEIYT